MSERMKIVAASGKIFQMILLDNEDDLAVHGADLIAKTIEDKNGNAVLCFATGSTPLPVYRELIRRYQAKQISFAKVHAFMLDEYIGLGPDDPNSFRYYMSQKLFSQIDIPEDQVHCYSGPVEDHMQSCFRYERAIKELGGIDMMLLGIGRNGHIAFNEPGCTIDSRCRLIKLTDDTRRANARFFESLDQVPQHALSMGIGNILEVKQLMMMATGSSKSEAVFNMLRGPVDSMVPASSLQMYNGECHLLIDRAASTELLEYRLDQSRKSNPV
ncbi:MAG: glucosamine-6-phosphate deaminase [Candidatus Alcyoniella australis]|nr:glucosamine-6-phosphate deaminase [Candidatus Alcyoniella australis]